MSHLAVGRSNVGCDMDGGKSGILQSRAAGTIGDHEGRPGKRSYLGGASRRATRASSRTGGSNAAAGLFIIVVAVVLAFCGTVAAMATVGGWRRHQPRECSRRALPVDEVGLAVADSSGPARWRHSRAGTRLAPRPSTHPGRGLSAAMADHSETIRALATAEQSGHGRDP
jgi:hypothetical protein